MLTSAFNSLAEDERQRTLWIAVGKSKMAGSGRGSSFCKGAFPSADHGDVWWEEFKAHQRSLIILKRSSSDHSRWERHCTLSMDFVDAHAILKVVRRVLAGPDPSLDAKRGARDAGGNAAATDDDDLEDHKDDEDANGAVADDVDSDAGEGDDEFEDDENEADDANQAREDRGPDEVDPEADEKEDAEGDDDMLDQEDEEEEEEEEEGEAEEEAEDELFETGYDDMDNDEREAAGGAAASTKQRRGEAVVDKRRPGGPLRGSTASAQAEGNRRALESLHDAHSLGPSDDAMFPVLGFGLLFFVIILTMLRRTTKALRSD